MKNRFFRVPAALMVLFCAVWPAEAQWLTQTNNLLPGWSAVYLFVDASSQSLDQMIANNPACPIDQIWLWKTPVSDAQYITTPESPLSGGGPWLSWSRTNLLNSLTALIPNAAYLIHSTAATNYALRVLGQPVPPSYVWDLTGLNFIGFSTPSVNPPNFQDFLAPDPAIASIVQIFEYLGGEFTTNVANPAQVLSLYATPVTRGQAFWVSATNSANNRYFGPFQLILPNPSGLAYGSSGGQLTLHLVNLTANPLTVSARLLASETPPAGQTNIAGPPPLLIEGALNTNNLTYTYASLAVSSTPGTSWTLAPSGQPGSEATVVLGLNRFALLNSAGSLYAGILQFTDSLGLSELDVPVSATASDNTGLWVGSASVTQVGYDLKSYATNADGSLLVNTVTSNEITTTAAALLTTNLLINYTATTNTTINYYDSTNVVINTYTNVWSQFGTNGFVLTTNVVINFSTVTNVIIETEVTGYEFDAGGNLVWLTANTTNSPDPLSDVTTNLVVATNTIAAVPVNGTPVVVTNLVITNYFITSWLVTNGIFTPPVTNEVFSSNDSSTNEVAGTNAAYNVIGTNWMADTYSTTNPPAPAISATTNVMVGTTAVTNYFPAPFPLQAFTNGANVITVNLVTNMYAVTNQVLIGYTTNTLVVNNTFVINDGGTNLVASITNQVAGTYTFTSSLTNYCYTGLAPLIATNAMFVTATNLLVTSYSNFVVTGVNTQLDNVAAPYPLRLILFNDSGGNCSLLQRVYFGLRQDTNLVVATTESVLDPTHLNTARRITATHLPWTSANTPWPFTGQLTQGGVLTLASPLTEAYDDQAANPFLHTYHPDHNNLDTQSPPHELPRGAESYDISRQITLNLGSTNNLDFVSLTQAGSTLSGFYNETITLTGLGGATKSYQTAGAFTINRISAVSALTTR